MKPMAALFNSLRAPLRSFGRRSLATATVSTRAVTLPSLEVAKQMPRHVSELSGDQLFVLSESCGHLGAARERLRREIMIVDKVDYFDTTDKLVEIANASHGNQGMVKAPYYASIYVALMTGWASLPLVFHYPTASLFNDYFVTADPPDVGEADTWLEVGAWSWNWMEPPLGTISFFLLCIQFAREQRLSIGEKAMTERIREYQADFLAKQYPQYDSSILRAYGSAIALHDDSINIREDGERIEALRSP